jgi:hypothetical protein
MREGFWVLAISLALAACAGITPPQTSIKEKGEVLFLDSRFSVSLLETQGVAMLPMASLGVAEGIRENALYEVQQALGLYLPRIPVVSKSEFLDRAKRVGLDQSIRAAVNDYEQSRRLNHRLISQVSLVDKTRYLLYVRVKEFGTLTKQEMASKYVELEAELWDSECVKVVWSGVGRVSVTEPVAAERTRFEDIFVGAARNLVAQLAQKKGERTKPEQCSS